MRKLNFLLILFLVPSLLWAEEPDQKALEAQLKLIQSQKTTAQSEIERGRLLMENGQLWLEKFTAQEQALTAKIIQSKTVEKPAEKSE